MRRSSKAIAAIFSASAVVAGAMSPLTARAQVVWQGPAGTFGSPGAPADFGTGSNWVGGVVPSGNQADINNGGTAQISSGQTFTVSEIWAGNNDAGTVQYGNVLQTGGSITASNGWVVVGRFGTLGDYNLAGGVVNQTGTGSDVQLFGNKNTSNANATMEIAAGATLNSAGILDIGESNGNTNWGNASVTVSGTINMQSVGQIYIGDDGNGDNSAGNGGIGTLTLNPGSMITANNWVVIGRSGYSTGTLNMNGGTLIYSGASGNFEVGGYQSNNVATLNLNAGLLQTNNIRTEDNGGSQTINFNGGTLQTNDSDSGFIGGHGTFSSLNVQNGGAVIDTNGYNIGITQGLSHGTDTNLTDGGLNKIGSGTLTLSASNTYNGPTNVNAGSLVVTGSLKSAITVSSGATLNLLGSTTSNVSINSGGTLGSYSATGTGGTATGNLTFTGTATFLVNPNGTQFLTVGGVANGSSGTIAVSPTISTPATGVAEEILYAKGGILGTISGSGANFVSTVRGTLSEVADPSTVGTDLILTSSGAANLTWQGTSATNPTYWDTRTTANWYNTGTSQTDVFYNNDNVTFDDTGSTLNVAIQGSVFPGSVTFNNLTKAYTFTGGAIAGPANLSIIGGGTVTLNQSNSYTGTTNISNGSTLAVGASGILPATTVVSLGNGASNGILRLGDATGTASTTVAGLNVVGTGAGNELIGGNSNASTLTVTTSVMIGTASTPTASLTLGAGASLYGNTGGNPSIGIGPSSGLNGTVNVLTGATLTSNSADIWIGNGGGVGTLNISGGTVVSNGWIAPGRTGGTGTINLTGGSLIKQTGNGNLDLGGDGSGSKGYLYQTGGTVTTSTFVDMGENGGGYGLWNMSGASSTANVASIIVGSSGSGTLNIFGGAQMVSQGTTIVGQNGGSSGSLNVTGATDITNGLTASNNATVTIGAAGIINIPGGQPNTAIASGSGTNATFNVLAGGTFNGGTGQVFIGDSSGTAVLNVSGTVNVDNYLAAGRIGGTGTINLNAGGTINQQVSDINYDSMGNASINLGNGQTILGSFGTGGQGTLNQTGGTFNSPNAAMILGETAGTTTAAPAVGIWNFNAGTATLTSGYTAPNNFYNSLTIGEGGNGTVNVSGTAALAAGDVVLATGSASGSTLASNGTLNVSSGTVTARSIDVGLGGNGTVNITGGHVTATSLTLASYSSSTASLNLSGGTLTATEITAGNSGNVPSFFINGATLQAGGNSSTFLALPSNTPVTIGSAGATLDTQTYNAGVQASLTGPGGLTKIGTGNLRLSVSNSYAGATTVSAGTLTVADPHALSTGSVYLGNHSTLALAATSSAIQFTNYNLNGQTSVFTPVVAASQTAVTMTTTTGSDATSIFDGNEYVSIQDSLGFAASFTYNHATTGPEQTGADGVIFVLQSGNGSPSVAGGAGGSIAYNGGPGFGQSLAAGVDLFLDRLVTGAGNGSAGAFTTPQAAENSAPVLSQSSSGTVTIVYNGAAQTLTETYTPSSGGTPVSLTTNGIDAAQLLGGSPGGTANAYLGFTASTGGATDLQTISDFKFNSTGTTIPSNNTTAVAITNPVFATGALSTIQLAPTDNYSSGTVGAITVGNGSTLALSIGSNAASGVVRGVLTAPSISFTNASSGIFDVSTNALDLTGQSLGSVTALVKSGFSVGNWKGNGITSTAASSDTTHLTALGVILNTVDQTTGGAQLYGSSTALGLFEGISPSSTDVLVKYTYYGDTNLDGKVDGSDYSRIDSTYESEAFRNGNATNPISGWYNGDFNYDGVVNGSDYTLMDNAFNSQGTQLNSEIASATAQIAGSPASSVPEPASLGLLAIGATGLLGRRRRRH